jgi:outer membrane immunogenic protein
MRKVIAAVLSAGTAASPALAQDEISPFSGARAEVILGYDLVGLSGEDVVQIFGDSQSLEGAAYGFGLGYDIDLSSAVAGGVEVELSDSSADFDFSRGGFTFGLDAGRDIYVGGRLGVAIGPGALIYGKAGYSNLKLTARASNAVYSEVRSDEVDGYRLGVGAELLFGASAYGKVEYRFSGYGVYTTRERDVDYDRHQVVAGIGLRL